MEEPRHAQAGLTLRRDRRRAFAGVDRGVIEPTCLDGAVSVFGLPATLHENDELAAYFTEGKNLVPHPAEADTWMDRYDVRLLLDDLSILKPGGNRRNVPQMDASDATQEQLDYERYRDLAAVDEEAGDTEGVCAGLGALTSQSVIAGGGPQSRGFPIATAGSLHSQ